MKILPLSVSFDVEMLSVVMTSVDLSKRRDAKDLCLIGDWQNLKNIQIMKIIKKPKIIIIL
jgi:hypothetical protein